MEIEINSLNNQIKEKCKEAALMNAVESYLKTECYDSYEKNNLKEAFEKAKHDDLVRSEIMNIIDEFLFEDYNKKIFS